MKSKFKIFLILSLIFSFSTSIAQEVDKKSLLDNLEFLSSDSFKGRKTGTEENLRARKFLVEEFKNIGLETHYKNYEQLFSFESRRQQKKIEGANVEGFVAGSESRKIIVITAHFDHVGIGTAIAGDSIYNGADDNASGTAALLALAKYFKENRPKHSMIFVSLDGEEMGLQGARALVNDFPFPLENIVLNINMDMISRNDKRELYASGTYHNPDLKPILEAASKGQSPKLVFGHDLPGTGSDDWSKSSDHGAFLEKEIPHIYFGVEDHPDYHRPSDEFKNIQPDFYFDAVNLILKCAIALDQKL
ncbi:M28 family peptidase [Algoriphagus machipongonensis]|uniref:Peptidase, M20/M25/M40 family n=1 Tax=Algoriphagus machipongonensis TaxID=388413 RepID=A3HUV7_9BACT|nr:M28 family peptidase [Algoriphagus machipongonensis]EAZ81929.1 peptidase, M20/M25/M40 family [Algoriphagus machipongonensis]